MKKSIVKFIVITSLLFYTSAVDAQGVNNNRLVLNKAFSAQKFGADNQFFLREAELQLRLLNFESAFLAYENAVNQNPQSAEVLLRRAVFRKRFGMLTEAKEDLRLADRINPYASDLYGFNGPNGILNVLYNQPEKALTNLTTYQRMNYYYQAVDRAYIEVEDREKELNLVEEIITNIEDNLLAAAENLTNQLINEHPQSALGYDLQGLIYTKKTEYDLASKSFSKAVSLEPRFAIAWYNFSRVAFEQEDLDQAAIYLNRAIELQSDLTKAYFDRAMLRKKQGENDKALEDYNKIIELRGDHYLEAYLNRGLTKKMLGDFTGALEDLNLVIEKSDANPRLLKNRGNLYLVFGYLNLAIEDYSKAIELDSDYGEAYFNRALAHFISYDMVSGCEDMKVSDELGFPQAQEKIKYFCTE